MDFINLHSFTEKSSSDSDEAPPAEFQVSPTGEATPTNDHVEKTDQDTKKGLFSLDL